MNINKSKVSKTQQQLLYTKRQILRQKIQLLGILTLGLGEHVRTNPELPCKRAWTKTEDKQKQQCVSQGVVAQQREHHLSKQFKKMA